MRPLTSLLAALLATTLLATTACSISFTQPKVWVEHQASLDIEGHIPSQLDCETHNGRIEVVGTASAIEPIVDVTINAGGRDHHDAEECRDAIDVFQRIEGDTLHLGWTWNTKKRSGWQATVHFDIRQSPENHIVAKSHNGGIRIEGVRGDCRVNTHNGRIELVDCGGAMDLEAHNGSISASGDSADARAKTHNGQIALDLRSPGVIRGSLETHNGAIRVSLPEGASTTVDASTHRGRVDLSRAYEIEKSSKRQVLAHRGGREGRLTVETHNGSITLR